MFFRKKKISNKENYSYSIEDLKKLKAQIDEKRAKLDTQDEHEHGEDVAYQNCSAMVYNLIASKFVNKQSFEEFKI